MRFFTSFVNRFTQAALTTSITAASTYTVARTLENEIGKAAEENPGKSRAVYVPGYSGVSGFFQVMLAAQASRSAEPNVSATETHQAINQSHYYPRK